MNNNEKYISILNLIQEEVERVLEQMPNGVEVAEPLKSKLLTLFNAPSKHIRPLVAFLYLKAIGENIDEKQVLYQSAIELVHNASLIHDDVIDESSSRRGIDTLNSEFGSKLAVISGDYLLSVALDKVLKIGDIRLIKIFKETLEAMSCGEINQYFNKFKIPTLDEYIKKSEQKTAKLFETALCGSLFIVDNSFTQKENAKRNIDRATEFARNFGIAFQIRDDLINCKTTNSDILEGIYTAPVIFSDSAEIGSEAIEKTQILLNNYIDVAIDCLSDIDENIYKQALVELLELMRHE